jgi:D-alanyl-lipoteichoic acid acyltransferase DltB (MBOAT superfamily)
MLFNSLEFILFLITVFVVYWFVLGKNLRAQNLFILIGSYFFYGWWDWKFLLLIAGSSLIDFIVSNKMDITAEKKVKRRWLILSLVINLGALFVFKYFNFFIDNFSDLLINLGFNANIWTLNLILPVGISFYTFQTLSYSIDVYRGKLKPSKDWIAFFGYVSFFPQLVAGPIERAVNLLPQFQKIRKFDYTNAVKGLEQILWGFFKKIVIADNCAFYVDKIFHSPEAHSPAVLWLGAVYFAFQIYGDFSGYSDIAIGTSKLFGFKLKRNFAFPYFSRDIAEFWRRWHISLSTWFRDYLYIPLGGSRAGKLKAIRNTFVIFLVSGFWHGANWTFIVWGGVHALLFLPLLLASKNRKNIEVVAVGSVLPSFREFGKMALTFILVTVAWVVFRADSITIGVDYIIKMFSFNELESITFYFLHPGRLIFPLFILIVVEWLNRDKEFGFDMIKHSKIIRLSSYTAIGLIIVFFGAFTKTEFIYFQF